MSWFWGLHDVSGHPWQRSSHQADFWLDTHERVGRQSRRHHWLVLISLITNLRGPICAEEMLFVLNLKKTKRQANVEKKRRECTGVAWEYHVQLKKYIHDSSLKLSVIVKKISGLVNDPRLGLDLCWTRWLAQWKSWVIQSPFIYTCMWNMHKILFK
jgi:hypothetical protein